MSFSSVYLRTVGIKLTQGSFFAKHKGYQLDFGQKIQKNVFTHNRRAIRRVSTMSATAASSGSSGKVSPPPATMSKQPTFVLSPGAPPSTKPKKAFGSSAQMKSRFFQSSSSTNSKKQPGSFWSTSF